MQKGIPYLQNSISQSLLEDFFLFCTMFLYSAVGSPRISSKVRGVRFRSKDPDLVWGGIAKG